MLDEGEPAPRPGTQTDGLDAAALLDGLARLRRAFGLGPTETALMAVELLLGIDGVAEARVTGADGTELARLGVRRQAATVRTVLADVPGATGAAASVEITFEGPLRPSQSNALEAVAGVLAGLAPARHHPGTDAPDGEPVDLHDPVTGLWARPAFVTHLQCRLTSGDAVAVLVVDLDDFGAVNREVGRRAGDRILAEVAGRLRHLVESPLHPHDRVARAGNDEFVAVCSGDDALRRAVELGDDVVRAMRLPALVGAHRVIPTVSVGITSSDGIGDAEQLLVEVDLGQREARRAGGNRFTVVDDRLRYDSRRRAVVARELETALVQGGLFLAYQPKVAVDRRAVDGVEALARWRHPEWGVVPPSEFIPVAEEGGMIEELGRWTLTEAFRQAADWQRRFPLTAPTVAVNVSARQFSSGLVETVEAALAASGADPHKLGIEVTETTIMDDVEAAAGMLSHLKGLGLRVSVDDFGTGYSSLAYLRRLPIDEIKVDQSFVRGLGENAEDTAVVAAVVAMAHGLGLSVVAEGVETLAQLTELHRLGCEMAQGFYFSPAVPPAEIDGFLSGRRMIRDGRAVADPAGGSTVLVADDAPEVRQLAKVSLSTAGFEVRAVASGHEVLALALAEPPGAIVLDVSMPDMNGLDVCVALRADPRTQGCTILMLSSHDDAAHKIEAFTRGADDYVVKPFAPRDLVARLTAAMDRRRAGEHIAAEREHR